MPGSTPGYRIYDPQTGEMRDADPEEAEMIEVAMRRENGLCGRRCHEGQWFGLAHGHDGGCRCPGCEAGKAG